MEGKPIRVEILEMLIDLLSHKSLRQNCGKISERALVRHSFLI
jgi:hypothetical protein